MLHNSEKDFIKRHIGLSKEDEKNRTQLTEPLTRVNLTLLRLSSNRKIPPGAGKLFFG